MVVKLEMISNASFSWSEMDMNTGVGTGTAQGATHRIALNQTSL
jgi:hypothetical protein